MKNTEIEKSTVFVINDILEYVADSIIIKTIIKRPTGNINALSFDSNEELIGKTSPFDTYIQLTEGKAEVIINRESHFIENGQSIIVPAHSSNAIKAVGRFKMLSLIIKSGYEEIV